MSASDTTESADSQAFHTAALSPASVIPGNLSGTDSVAMSAPASTATPVPHQDTAPADSSREAPLHRRPRSFLQRPPRPTHRRHTGRLRRLGFILLLVVLALGASATGWTFHTVQSSLAQTSGTLRTPGLLAPVTITRDQYGVPHIVASNAYDLNFAQGFVTCQDRCYQMEQLVRLASGRLSEVYGAGPDDSYLQTDIFFRTLNFDGVSHAEYASLSGSTRDQLLAYTAGVNAAIHSQSPSLEDTVSQSSPLIWQPWYPLEIARLGSFGFSDWYIKLVAGLVAAHAPNLPAQAYPPYPASNPIVLGTPTATQASPAANIAASPAVTQTLAHLPAAVLTTYARITAIAGIEGGHIGSNNWVVDGSLSASGSSIEAGDPHVPTELPGFWYEVQLTIQANPATPPTEDATGAALPGVPGILLGHNQWAAWSLTIAEVSSEDLYTLSQSGCESTAYRYDGSCLPFETRSETIPVSGQASYHLSVYSTQQGAVMLPTEIPVTATTSVPLAPQYAHTLALRSTLFDPSLHISNAFAMATMSTWSQFLADTNNIPLGINWLVGTTSGEIGYRMSGVLPMQPQAALYQPVDGTTSATTWEGYVPQSQMPRLIDPKAIHELVTANNQVVPLSASLQVGGYPDQGYRAARIVQLLNQIPAGTATVAGMQAIQTDVTSLPAQILNPYFQQAGANADTSAERASALLDGWNGTTTANSTPAAIYELTLANLVRDVMQPRLGTTLYQSWVLSSPDEGSGPTAVAIAIVEHPTLYFSGTTAQAQAARDQAIAQAEQQAIAALTQQFGSNPNNWAWGKLHQLTLGEQGLSTLPIIGQAFAVANMPRPGDENTINQGGNYDQYLDQPNYTQTYGSVYRQIIDLGNPTASLWILAPGESGQPFSAHFSDQFSLWNQGGYTSMNTSPALIQSHPHQALTLTP